MGSFLIIGRPAQQLKRPTTGAVSILWQSVCHAVVWQGKHTQRRCCAHPFVERVHRCKTCLNCSFDEYVAAERKMKPTCSRM